MALGAWRPGGERAPREEEGTQLPPPQMVALKDVPS